MADDADIDPLRQAYGPDSLSTADVMAQYRAPATPYENAMAQARSLHSGMLGANPIEMAMGLLGPKARLPVSELGQSLMRRLATVPKPPPREVLGADIPFVREPSLDGATEFWSVRPPGTDPIWEGLQATANLQKRSLHITGSELPKDQRGQGIGLAMYQRLIDQAHKHGYSVHSDNAVSGDAQKIYAALAQRGYQVARNQRAALSSDSGRLRVDYPSEPVFTVHPPDYASPAIAEIMRRALGGKVNYLPIIPLLDKD